MPRQPAWLALMLVALVISLCLSQRMGLSTACPYSAAAHETPVSPSSVTPDSSVQPPSASSSDSVTADDNERCSLSEQLLSKVWSQLEPIVFAIFLLFSLWLSLPQLSYYCRRFPPPPSFAGRRRHLVLCVFRE